jgi:hypothetical protein
MSTIINFETQREFTLRNFESLAKKAGCYVIFTKDFMIPYPHKNSRVIYIGVSKKTTNGIKSRLESHYSGVNRGIKNYMEQKGLLFTYIETDWLSKIISAKADALESYLILDFAEKYGCYPICNNRSEGDLRTQGINLNIDINWGDFE